MQRLRSKAQFQAAMAGFPVAKTSHFALHLTSLTVTLGEVLLFPMDCPWVGVLIPKRWARRAVTRNTIRRQIYEVTRTAQGSLPHAGMVVRLRAEFSRKQFISASSEDLKRAVREELLQLVSRIKSPVACNGVPDAV